MKKFTLISMLFIATIACFSQEKENLDFLKQNEVKINMSN
jgi:hypothetical protein